MRSFAFVLLIGSATVFSTAASAQGGATRTADEIVCQYVDCSASKTPQAAEDSREVGDLKGFSMAVRKPGQAKPSSAEPTAPARPTLATAPGPSPRNIGRASGGKSVASVRQTAPTPIHGRKADMRVSFLKNSANLTEQAKAEAKVFAQAMQRPELAQSHFRIEGHTDSSGARTLNLDLSARRAAAVADYLTSLGVARTRLETKGFGPDRPMNGRPASAPENRRVEAVLL